MNELALTNSEKDFNLFDPKTVETMLKVAAEFSKTEIIPKHFQGKPADCFVGMQMAARMGVDPFMVLQNLYVVHGTPGFSAKFLIALAERSGLISPIEYDVTGSGETLSVTAYATLTSSGNRVEATCDWKMATEEGWTKNTKYKSMPEQMLKYRASGFLIRLYAPSATLGMHSKEELEIHGPMEREATGRVIPESAAPAVPPKRLPAEPEKDNKPDSLIEKVAETLDAKELPFLDCHDDLRELLATAGMEESDFLRFAGTGKDAPKGGYWALADLPEDRVNAAIEAWPTVSKKAAKWIAENPAA